jgi:multidrug efflux pump subunit AcrA (membrane-fusion protein)
MKKPADTVREAHGGLENRRKMARVVGRRHLSILVAISLAAIVGGCRKKAVVDVDVRPVRTIAVEPGAGTEKTTLTGEIRARHASDLGFRIEGKIIERPVDIGSTVKTGDVLARLDPQPRQQDLRSAKADAASAQATLTRDQATRC